MTKRTWTALLVASLSVFATGDAFACGEALLEDTEAVAKTREAEDALEHGDVATARALAAEVERDATEIPVARTIRARALSFVRDPRATAEQVDDAVVDLEKLDAKYGDDTFTRQALGEALSRSGNAKRAYERLADLEESDVIASAWTHAAIARSARAVGDAKLAETALDRCQTTAIDPRICRGEYPRQPLFRGKAFAFFLSAFVFLFGVLLRRSARFSPWSEHEPRLFATVIGAGALAPFLLPRSPGLAIACAVLSVAFVVLAQPRLFFRAVRKGSVPGLAIRPASAEDDSLPMLGFFFGPPGGLTLERAIDAPSYRSTARDALLRVGRLPRALTRWRMVVPLALAGMLVLCGLGVAGAFVGPRQIQRAISSSI